MTNSSKNTTADFVFVPVKNEFIKIRYHDITTIKASGNFVDVKVNNISVMVLSNLTQFTKQLPERIFVRIHKTWSVNLCKVDKYTNDHIIIDDEIIPFGASYKKQIMEILKINSIKREG